MAPERPQKSANATAARHTCGVKSWWEKITPAKTKKFFTHCRGRSETTTAVNNPIGRAIVPSRAARGRLVELSSSQHRAGAEARAGLADAEQVHGEAELVLVLVPVDVL